jgi:outer membrane biosynthesis protein TonB
MRKLILIAAMVLASATANLTMAANDQPTVAETKAADKATEQPPVEAAKFVKRPAAVDSATETPQPESAKPVAEKSVETPKVEKPKRKRMSTEARVIYELHRHGIYW